MIKKIIRLIKGKIIKNEIERKVKNDFKHFLALSAKSTNKIYLKNVEYNPIYENTKGTIFDRHYIYHTSWAARYLAKVKPTLHIDISSSLFFSGICSAFNDISFYDYRPANLILDNLNCLQADLINLPFKNNSIFSLSCMHTVEHVGLGRYGDELDPDGDIKAISELKRVLAIKGNLIFVVPIGNPKIVFNAHRIYSHDQILTFFEDLELIEFVLIPENEEDGGLVYSPSKELLEKQNYGCGCYWFKKNRK